MSVNKLAFSEVHRKVYKRLVNKKNLMQTPYTTERTIIGHGLGALVLGRLYKTFWDTVFFQAYQRLLKFDVDWRILLISGIITYVTFSQLNLLSLRIIHRN